jgi:uncharacterized protein YyaL (SSP411 family)
MHAEVAAHYLPFALIIPVEPGERQQALAQTMPYLGAMRTIEDRATVFVCRDFACRQPVATRDALRQELTRG